MRTSFLAPALHVLRCSAPHVFPPSASYRVVGSEYIVNHETVRRVALQDIARPARPVPIKLTGSDEIDDRDSPQAIQIS
jgi:hypothetical protein